MAPCLLEEVALQQMTHHGSWCVVLLCCCSAVANLYLSFLLSCWLYVCSFVFKSSSVSKNFPLLCLHLFLCLPLFSSSSLPLLFLVPTPFQVSECNWPSRQAPSLHNLFAVCKNMHNWLKQNPKNVCVITCSVRRRSPKAPSSYSALSSVYFLLFVWIIVH